jgi:hypothetical protein
MSHVNLERGLKGQAVRNIFPQGGPNSGKANIKHDQEGVLYTMTLPLI